MTQYASDRIINAPIPTRIQLGMADNTTHVVVATAKSIVTASQVTAEHSPDKYYTLLSGRYMGLDSPNIKGDMVTATEAVTNLDTVVHSPLNWGHSTSTVVGCYVSASAELESSVGPHLAVRATFWRWIYPQLTATLDAALNRGVVAQSMELFPSSVQCAGDNGCGGIFSWYDAFYETRDICDHLRARASVRRLVDPVFIGGAIVVPPQEPAWSDAVFTREQQKSLRDMAARADVSPELLSSVVSAATHSATGS